MGGPSRRRKRLLSCQSRSDRDLEDALRRALLPDGKDGAAPPATLPQIDFGAGMKPGEGPSRRCLLLCRPKCRLGADRSPVSNILGLPGTRRCLLEERERHGRGQRFRVADSVSETLVQANI